MTMQRPAHKQEGTLARDEFALWYRAHAASERKGSFAQKARRLVIHLFIAFHLIAIAFWCVPLDSPLIPLCRDLVRPYFLWAGLFQSWDMFAPIPKGANTYIEAALRYRDG
jgi:hypothetical protein